MSRAKKSVSRIHHRKRWIKWTSLSTEFKIVLRFAHECSLYLKENNRIAALAFMHRLNIISRNYKDNGFGSSIGICIELIEKNNLGAAAQVYRIILSELLAAYKKKKDVTRKKFRKKITFKKRYHPTQSDKRNQEGAS